MDPSARAGSPSTTSSSKQQYLVQGILSFFVLLFLGTQVEFSNKSSSSSSSKHLLSLDDSSSNCKSLQQESSSSSSNSNIGAACNPPTCHPTDMIWIGRPKIIVRFDLGKNDGSTTNPEFTVFSTNYIGSTLTSGGINFWDSVNAHRWEPETFRVIRGVLKGHRQASYIDFGSWIGPTVLYASLFCDNVFSLEPDPIAFSALIANLNENKDRYSTSSGKGAGAAAAAATATTTTTTTSPRPKVYFQCISTSDGDVEMNGSGDSTSRIGDASSDGRIATTGNGLVWSVTCRTLPQFIQEENVKNLRMFKMDTEGAERFLLPSLKAWLQDSFDKQGIVKPAIWLSLHYPFWTNANDEDLQKVWDVIGMYKYVWRESLGNPINTSPERFGDLCRDFCEYLLSDEMVSFE